MYHPWAPELPFPMDHRHNLKEAMAVVRQFRTQEAATVYRWEPEWDLHPGERPRRELILALCLVQGLGTGDGGFEARLTACRRLYIDGRTLPIEALKAAELLLRSRIVTGTTDLETFWLAAAFAHPLSPFVPAGVADLAWRYLSNAPFCLDDFSAIDFARLSIRHRAPPRPRWPWELTTPLLQRPEVREVGISLLEAMLCVQVKANSIEAAAARLPPKLPLRTPIYRDLVQKLAQLYAEEGSDAWYARQIAEEASRLGDRAAEIYVESQVFDLPYQALAEQVRDIDPVSRDETFARAVATGKYQVARRLVELELVQRGGTWKRGPLYPRLEEVVEQSLSHEAWRHDQRLRELLLRTSLLYARTRHYTPLARRLGRVVIDQPELAGDTLEELRPELEEFLQECDPFETLRYARRKVETRLGELDQGAREVLIEAHEYLGARFELRREVVDRAARAMTTPFSMAMGLLTAEPVEAAVERALVGVTRLGRGLVDVPRLQSHISYHLNRPYQELGSVHVTELRRLATEMSHVDRMVAMAGGAAAGLLGGPWGATLDLLNLVALSARSVARIGLCYGILPGTPAGFHLLSGSLALASSSDGGEGLVTLLRSERPRRLIQPIRMGRVLFAGAQATWWARGLSADMGAFLARQIGFSLTEKRMVRLVPVVGAVLAAGADYLFLKAIGEAAVNLGARMFLLEQIDAPAPEDPALCS